MLEDPEMRIRMRKFLFKLLNILKSPLMKGLVEIRWVINSFTQLLATLASTDARVQVNPIAKTATSRIRDFTRMNPPTFYRSKVDEDPQGFIDEVYKVLYAIGVSFQEKEELTTYQLKYIAHVWYDQ